MNSFGNILKKARIQANLTQEQLAEKMDVSSVAVQKWESGTTTPKLSNLKKLSYFFNIPLKYLCWHAAHNDIAWHRSMNHHGEKFIVLSRICKSTKMNQFGEKESIYNYEVFASHKIKQKQINYIQQNQDLIVSQIQKNHKPSLSMFHISENA